MAETRSLRLEILVDDKGTPVVKQFAGGVQHAADAMDKHAGGATRTLNDGLTKLTSGFGSALKSAAGFATGLLGIQTGAAAIGSAFNAMQSFEAELSNVNTLLKDSPVSIAQLRDELIKLPPEFGTSTDLAKGLYQALSAGVEPAKAVAFVGDAARLAKAGLTETETAVKVLTTTMDAYGKGAQEAGHISDVLFTAVRLGKTTMDELANSIGTVLPIASTMGVSFEEAAATVTTLTKVFPSTSQAVTGLRSVLSGMLQNMDKFKAAGIDITQVIAEKGLTGAIDALKTATGGSAEKVRAFIPDVEGLTAVLGLMGAQLDTQKANVKAFGDTTGATSDAFAKSQDNLKEALKTLAGVVDRLVQEHAPPLLDALKEITDFLSANAVPAVTWLKDAWNALQPVLDAVNKAFDVPRATLALLVAGVSYGIEIILKHLATLTSAASKAADVLGLEGTSAKLASVSSSLASARDAAQDFGDTWLDVAGDFGKRALDTAQSVLGIGDAYAASADTATRAGKTLDDVLRENKLTLDDVRHAASQIAPAMQPAASAVASVASALDGTKDALQLIDGVWTNTSRSVQAHTADVHKTREAYDELGLKTPQLLKEGLDKGVAAFRALAAASDTSKDALTAAAQEVVARLQAYYGEDLTPAIKAEFAEIIKAAQGTTAPLTQAGTDAGQGYGAGLTAGIQEAKSNAIQAWDELIAYTKANPVDKRAYESEGGGGTRTTDTPRAEPPEASEPPRADAPFGRDYVRETLGGDFAPIEHAFGDTRDELERQLADYTRQRANVARGYLTTGGSTLGTRGYREYQLPRLDDALAHVRERLQALDDGLGVREGNPYARPHAESPSAGTTRRTTSRAAGVGVGDPTARYEEDPYFANANLPGRAGGGSTVTVTNPSFNLTMTGIDPHALDGRAVVTAILPALREAIRRGELSSV